MCSVCARTSPHVCRQCSVLCCGTGRARRVTSVHSLCVCLPAPPHRTPCRLYAEMMVIWGEALYFTSPGIIGYAVLMTLFAQWVVVRVEEPELRERFGEAYRSYCQRVPRWIPLLGRSPRELR